MLNRKSAQKIVNKMMEVVPYNINVMDNEGVIIGSGDQERIGTLHYGAAEALTKKDEVCIYKDDEFVRRGVNIPILFKDEIVGVIGVTGSPSEVKNFTKLIKVTAELLLSEQYSLKNKMMREKVRDEFFYEWIYRRNEYSNDIIVRGKSLNIDILKKRIVVTVYSENKDNSSLSEEVKSSLELDEYVFSVSHKRLAVIMNYDNYNTKRIQNLCEKLAKYNVKIGVGNYNEILNKSLNQSIKAVTIGRKLLIEQSIIYYNDIKFYYDNLLNFKKDKIYEIKNKIESHKCGDELLETLLIYIELNGEKNKIAEKMHIHRNTLNYRLNIIENITGLNLNNYMNLYIFMTLFLIIKLEA